MQTIEAGVSVKDGCPILPRIKSFITQQGVLCRLKHVMRDRKGNPIDFTQIEEYQANSASSSSSIPNGISVVLMAKEWSGRGYSDTTNPIFNMPGEFVAPEQGIVSCALDKKLLAEAGIYELSWGILDSERNALFAEQGILSVERTLLGSFDTQKNRQGPFTINELRMLLMDSSNAENFLLDEVEFSDEQLLLAMSEPINEWNETPPPIRKFTTRDFPFFRAWATGVKGALYVMAAAWYRKNSLQSAGGGLQVQDRNKEREYMTEGLRLKEEYTKWLLNKKVEINMKLFVGSAVTAYSRHSGW